jgi:hypothetical protein
MLLDDRCEPALEEIVLVILKHYSHLGVDMLLKEPIVLGENRCR